MKRTKTVIPGRFAMCESKNLVSVRQSLLSVRFLLSSFILVLAAIGLRPGMKALAEYYEKEPIAIRRPLKEFDVSRLSSFQDNWEAKSCRTDEDIGTNEYAYIKFKKKDSDKSSELFVTYYSNPKDKVAHTADVCYRQAGAIVKKMTTIMLDTPQLAPEHPQIQVCILTFKWPTSNVTLIYCFYVEGRFELSRERVRWLITKPGNHYTYFSKIETAMSYPADSDPTEAIETCKTLFREALPVLLADHFPDKEQIKHR